MQLPYGFDLNGDRNFVMKLNKSIYALCQSSSNWYQHLTNGLKARDFFPSQVDPCVYYRENCIVLVFVDDCLIFSKDKSVIDGFIYSLQHGEENYILTDEGEIEKYLGVEIIKSKDGTMELRQPFLIDRCLEAMQVDSKMNIKKTPSTKPLLHKNKDGDPRKHTWHYRSVIGMLNYLKGSTRPDLDFVVHQCARFSEDPKASHEQAVRQIGKYLLGTKDRGVIFNPDKEKGLE